MAVKPTRINFAAFKLPTLVTVALQGRPPVIMEIFGSITEEKVDEWTKLITTIQSDNSLLMLLSSGGGTKRAQRIAELIKLLDVPKAALVIGEASSMGLVMLGSIPKACRFALPSARFCAHYGASDYRYGGQCDLEAQTIGGWSLRETLRFVRQKFADQLKEEAIFQEELRRIVGKKLTPSYLRGNHFLTAQEALDWGIISQICSGGA